MIVGSSSDMPVVESFAVKGHARDRTSQVFVFGQLVYDFIRMSECREMKRLMRKILVQSITRSSPLL